MVMEKSFRFICENFLYPFVLFNNYREDYIVTSIYVYITQPNPTQENTIQPFWTKGGSIKLNKKCIFIKIV